MATPVLLALTEADGAALLARLPPERRAAVATTPEQAAEALRPYLDAGFTGFTFNNPVLPHPGGDRPRRRGPPAHRDRLTDRASVPVPRRGRRADRRAGPGGRRAAGRVDRLQRPGHPGPPHRAARADPGDGRDRRRDRAAPGRDVRAQQRPPPPGRPGPGPGHDRLLSAAVGSRSGSGPAGASPSTTRSALPSTRSACGSRRLDEGIAVLKGCFADGPVHLPRRALHDHRPRRPAEAGPAAPSAAPPRRRRPAPPVAGRPRGRHRRPRAAAAARRPADPRADPRSITLEATAEKIGWVREAAGDRFDRLELNVYPSSPTSSPITPWPRRPPWPTGSASRTGVEVSAGRAPRVAPHLHRLARRADPEVPHAPRAVRDQLGHDRRDRRARPRSSSAWPGRRPGRGSPAAGPCLDRAVRSSCGDERRPPRAQDETSRSSRPVREPLMGEIPLEGPGRGARPSTWRASAACSRPGRRALTSGPGHDDHARRVRGARRRPGDAPGRGRARRPLPVRLGLLGVPPRQHARDRRRRRAHRPGRAHPPDGGGPRAVLDRARHRRARPVDGRPRRRPGAPGFRRRGDPADRLRRDRPGPARCAPAPDVRRPVDRLGPAGRHRPAAGRRGRRSRRAGGSSSWAAAAHRAGRGDHPARPPDGPAAGPTTTSAATRGRGTPSAAGSGFARRGRRRRGVSPGRPDERQPRPGRPAGAGGARAARAGLPAADAARDPPGPARACRPRSCSAASSRSPSSAPTRTCRYALQRLARARARSSPGSP